MMKTDKYVITVGTNTAAMRAQRILQRNGVRCDVVRRTDARGGCVFGLEINRYDYETAIYILGRNGISIGIF
ncbi:MAG: DUF3343 domain-containing protein [Clostridia bacterium]|nr:DUF3343 domain-containing protein [Clostridia bacterium]